MLEIKSNDYITEFLAQKDTMAFFECVRMPPNNRLLFKTFIHI